MEINVLFCIFLLDKRFMESYLEFARSANKVSCRDGENITRGNDQNVLDGEKLHFKVSDLYQFF